MKVSADDYMRLQLSEIIVVLEGFNQRLWYICGAVSSLDLCTLGCPQIYEVQHYWNHK